MIEYVLLCHPVSGHEVLTPLKSQLGYHDSELAIVMEDTDLIDSKMDGQDYKAGRHIATLRRALWREHLGLLPAQDLDASNDINAQPPGDLPNDYRPGPEDQFVEDPLSDDLWSTWTTQATTNTEVFRQLFRADPDDNIKTFEQYDHFMPGRKLWKQGHLADPYMPIEEVKQKLDKVRGHLVWMPLDFLDQAEMAEPGLSVNQLTEVWSFAFSVLFLCMSPLILWLLEYLHVSMLQHQSLIISKQHIQIVFC